MKLACRFLGHMTRCLPVTSSVSVEVGLHEIPIATTFLNNLGCEAREFIVCKSDFSLLSQLCFQGSIPENKMAQVGFRGGDCTVVHFVHSSFPSLYSTCLQPFVC